MRIEAQAGLIAYRGVQLAVRSSDLPERQRTAAATYLLVVACNVPQALAAEIRGTSKQNVTNLMNDIARWREQSALTDRVLVALEAELTGEDDAVALAT